MNDPNPKPASAPPPSKTSQRLFDKVAIVTGSSSGVGRAIAFAYAAEGAKVVCADLDPIAKVQLKEEDGKPTHEVIHERDGQSIFVRCDVADSESMQALVEKAVQEYGRLDIMVNNAGTAPDCTPTTAAPIFSTADSTFDTCMRVNARSNFLGCKYASKQMIEQAPHACGDRGWIINMASGLGLVGQPGVVSYAASKGAIVNLTRAVALDLAPHRVHCNSICPGVVNTPMSKSFTENDAIREKLMAGHPLKGFGEPEDVAKVAVFLASEDAGWITGVPLPVDGGYVAQ